MPIRFPIVLMVSFMCIATYGTGKEQVSHVSMTPVPSETLTWEQVDTRALDQAAKSHGAGILLIGDSLTSQNPLTILCGKRVIVAGYDGATWNDVKERSLWPHIQALIVIVMLGTNDSKSETSLDPSWLSDVKSFLGVLHRRIEHVILVLPPPISDPVRIARLRQIWRMLEALEEETLDARVIQDPQNFTDGLHLTNSGYRLLNAIYKKGACPWIRKLERKEEPS